MIFQYKVSSLGANRISYKIFDISHVSKVAAHFQKKNVHIFIQVSKRRKWKNIKKRGCRAVFNTLPNIYDGAFLRKYNDKKLHHTCLIWFSIHFRGYARF